MCIYINCKYTILFYTDKYTSSTVPMISPILFYEHNILISCGRGPGVVVYSCRTVCVVRHTVATLT